MIYIKTDNIDEWNLCNKKGIVVNQFKTEKELKRYIALKSVYEAKIESIKILMLYPSKVSINGKICSEDEEKEIMFLKWYDKVTDIDNYDEYYKSIDSKLEELLG